MSAFCDMSHSPSLWSTTAALVFVSYYLLVQRNAPVLKARLEKQKERLGLFK